MSICYSVNIVDIAANYLYPMTSYSFDHFCDLTIDSNVVEANTKFAFKLFQKILKQEGEKNVFVSPISVAIALIMTYNGASGDTQQAMAKTLELQGISLEKVNEANASLVRSLENADSDVKLSVSNSLWARQGIDFYPEFIQTNQQFYDAKIQVIDFDNPHSPKVINSWVKKHTQGKIEKIIDNTEIDGILLLLNAIYFKGNWTEKFDHNLTVKLPFYLLNGTTKYHPLMSGSGSYNYYENEIFQAVSLPYGEERLSFYIFLPRKSTTLESFQQQLSMKNWQKWIKEFKLRDGTIKLPRFKLEYELQLKDVLSNLGMAVAFTKQADFANMTPISTNSNPVVIKEVKHKTFIEVNEEGTEAAAVTEVFDITIGGFIPFEEPFQMVVDRPFYCGIGDNQTGTVLFMGQVVEPM
ncbi:MAG: serpin family protein [Symploca sp. SIO3C6]|nr:serpin family protein [Symploca sp. SIO3C6]